MLCAITIVISFQVDEQLKGARRAAKLCVIAEVLFPSYIICKFQHMLVYVCIEASSLQAY